MTRYFFLLFAAVLLCTPLYAQPGPPPDPDVPITGIEFLLGGGLLLGLRKIYNQVKSHKKQ